MQLSRNYNRIVQNERSRRPELCVYSVLYFCFLICGLSNCAKNPKINSADSVEDFDPECLVLSQGTLKYGVSSMFAAGTKVAMCTSKRKFLRRRLLYSCNGSQSFNPVIIQIILSGDVHPHPGPN